MTAEVQPSWLHGIVTVLLVPSPQLYISQTRHHIHYLGQNASAVDPKELFKGSLKEQKQSLTDHLAKHQRLQKKRTSSLLCCCLVFLPVCRLLPSEEILDV